MKALLLESDPLMARELEGVLMRADCEVLTICDPEEGSDYALRGACDLLVLDAVSLKTACQLTEEVRNRFLHVMIILIADTLTAEERAYALESGADYSFSRPVFRRELIAAVHALRRRTMPREEQLQFGNTLLDLPTHRMLCNGRSVRLTSREFDVFKMLMTEKERLLSKETILGYVWGTNPRATDNYVEAYIAFLRKKLSAIDSDVRITAQRNLGYCLEEINTEQQSSRRSP